MPTAEDKSKLFNVILGAVVAIVVALVGYFGLKPAAVVTPLPADVAVDAGGAP